MLFYIKKVLLWFLAAYIFGFLIGALIATLTFGPHPILYIFGLIFSIKYTIFYAGPVFFMAIIPYFIIDKKYKIDGDLKCNALLAMVIALISAFLFSISERSHIARLESITLTIFFFSTLFGIFLPRVVAKYFKLKAFH